MNKARWIVVGLALAVTLTVITPALYAQGGPVYAQPDQDGTVVLPPKDSQFVGEYTDAKRPIRIIIIHWFFPTPVPGPLPDEVFFTSRFRLEIIGQDELAGLKSVVDLDADTLVASSPQTPNKSRQVLTTDMRSVQGSVQSHPDFELVEIVGGTSTGVGSPGTTVLTQQSNGSVRVEASFNVGYQVRLVGRDGSPWEGVDTVIDAQTVMTIEPESISNGL